MNLWYVEVADKFEHAACCGMRQHTDPFQPIAAGDSAASSGSWRVPARAPTATGEILRLFVGSASSDHEGGSSTVSTAMSEWAWRYLYFELWVVRIPRITVTASPSYIDDTCARSGQWRRSGAWHRLTRPE